MLYALGVGMGTNPLDERELAFTCEPELKVLPTFATIVARAGDPRGVPLDRRLVLDGGRDLTIFRPLPAAARVTLDGRIVDVVDRGEKGAIVTREVVISDADGGGKYASLVTHVIARGDGGFGGPPETRRAVREVPARAADLRIELPTRPDQALLYRLSGDRNPLHSDPRAARKAGFDRPILHGLCTYGICCRAVVQGACDHDADRIRRFAARFSAPAYPGDTIAVDLWQDGNEIIFEATTLERGEKIIRNGFALID
jgi:acyl dehydratase